MSKKYILINKAWHSLETVIVRNTYWKCIISVRGLQETIAKLPSHVSQGL